MNPLISIVIPIYNVEAYLKICIESVLVQTYTNIEILLVNDGSPDNCGKICNEYALIDNRIKVIHKENGGLSDARNIALDIIEGEYVTFIDSDDSVAPDYIETLYNLIKEYNVTLSISGFIHVYEGKEENKIDGKSLSKGFLSAFNAIETMFYQNKFETSAWGKLYKKELFGNEIRYPKGLLYEDLPTTYKLILKAGNVAYTNKRTYYYLLRKDSIQCSKFNTKKLDILKVADMMLENIQNNYPSLSNSLKCRLFSSYLNVFLQTEKGSEFETVLWKRIVKYRVTVLLNLKGRNQAIVAAIISLFGISVLRYCFSLINIRKSFIVY